MLRQGVVRTVIKRDWGKIINDLLMGCLLYLVEYNHFPSTNNEKTLYNHENNFLMPSSGKAILSSITPYTTFSLIFFSQSTISAYSFTPSKIDLLTNSISTFTSPTSILLPSKQFKPELCKIISREELPIFRPIQSEVVYSLVTIDINLLSYDEVSPCLSQVPLLKGKNEQGAEAFKLLIRMQVGDINLIVTSSNSLSSLGRPWLLITVYDKLLQNQIQKIGLIVYSLLFLLSNPIVPLLAKVALVIQPQKQNPVFLQSDEGVNITDSTIFQLFDVKLSVYQNCLERVYICEPIIADQTTQAVIKSRKPIKLSPNIFYYYYIWQWFEHLINKNDYNALTIIILYKQK